MRDRRFSRQLCKTQLFHKMHAKSISRRLHTHKMQLSVTIYTRRCMVHEVGHARARSDTDFHSKRLNCVANRTHRERMGRWSHATWFSACYDKLVLVANQQQSTSLSTNRASDDYFIFPPATKSKTTIKTVAIRSASDMESAFAYSHFAIDRMIGVKSSMSFVLSPTWCYYCHVYVICSSSPIR